MEFRIIGPGDAALLAELFQDVDDTFFRPHPFTPEEACRLTELVGRDAYALLLDGGRPVAYGMLRGWDEGFVTPSLGIAVRTSAHRRGYGREMMVRLHAEARRRGALRVRLRVHRENHRARRLYESLGYRYRGEDRGEFVMLVDLDAPGGPWRHATLARDNLKARLVDISAPECVAFLAEVPHDFYHLPAYVRLWADEEEGVAKALFVEENGRRLFVPLALRPIQGADRYDAISPYGYPGPLADVPGDEAFVRDALEAGLAVLAEEGAVSAFLRFHPLLSPAPPADLDGVVRQGATISIDLTLQSSQLWEQTRRNHRRDIMRSAEVGMVARVDAQFERYTDLQRLYRETMERRGASVLYIFRDSYWEGLRDALGDRLHLLVVEVESRCVAAGLFVESDGIVQFHLTGSSAGYPHAEPSKLLIHFARGWAKDRGNHYLHLGGGLGASEDSLLHFKAGFSPLKNPYFTMRAILDEREYRRLAELDEATGRSLDPMSFFPAYRSGRARATDGDVTYIP